MTIKNQDAGITNQHGDHIASCLCCEKFDGSMGTSGYSELTPGTPGSIDCNEGEFGFCEDDDWHVIMTTIHNTARHCKLFAPRASE